MRVIRTVSTLSLTHNSRILMNSSSPVQTSVSQMQSTTSTEQLAFGHASSLPAPPDNANVNTRPEGRHWTAMTETERQLTIAPASLKTAAEARFADALPNVR